MPRFILPNELILRINFLHFYFKYIFFFFAASSFLPVSYESAKACAVVVDNTETQSDAIIARSNAISGAMLPDDVSKEYSSASSSSSPSVLSEYLI